MEGLVSMILTYLNQHTGAKLYIMEGLASMILKYLNQHTGAKLYIMEGLVSMILLSTSVSLTLNLPWYIV
jgi:hypothetical protein